MWTGWLVTSLVVKWFPWGKTYEGYAGSQIEKQSQFSNHLCFGSQIDDKEFDIPQVDTPPTLESILNEVKYMQLFDCYTVLIYTLLTVRQEHFGNHLNQFVREAAPWRPLNSSVTRHTIKQFVLFFYIAT